jgi:hypothetical protein
LLCYIFLLGIYVFFRLFSSSPFHVNSLFSYIFFHYKYFSFFILSTRNIFHSHMWPYQIYVTITIIVFIECLSDNCIVPSNWKNPLVSVTFPKFGLNVWKQMINNFNITFFLNLYLNCFPHFSLLLVLIIEDQKSLNYANRLLGVPL